MAGTDGNISTESDDADDSPDDSTASKQLPSEDATGLRDSGSDQDQESELELGEIPKRRRRIEWDIVETWDREDRENVDEAHIQSCIENHARELMRVSGLPFAPGMKKKPTSLEGWVRRSKKVDKDGLFEVNTCQFT